MKRMRVAPGYAFETGVNSQLSAIQSTGNTYLLILLSPKLDARRPVPKDNALEDNRLIDSSPFNIAPRHKMGKVMQTTRVTEGSFTKPCRMPSTRHARHFITRVIEERR